MKEIKFRAWDKHSNTMRPQYGVISKIEFDQSNIPSNLGVAEYVQIDEEGNGDWNMFEITEFELMQYTGLKDKNGVEIFEGDIVRYPENPRDRYPLILTCAVEFTEAQFEPVSYWAMSLDEMTVIGNIHENPELLTAE